MAFFRDNEGNSKLSKVRKVTLFFTLLLGSRFKGGCSKSCTLPLEIFTTVPLRMPSFSEGKVTYSGGGGDAYNYRSNIVKVSPLVCNEKL